MYDTQYDTMHKQQRKICARSHVNSAEEGFNMQCKEEFLYSGTLKSAHFLIRFQNIVYILADLGK